MLFVKAETVFCKTWHCWKKHSPIFLAPPPTDSVWQHKFVKSVRGCLAKQRLSTVKCWEEPDKKTKKKQSIAQSFSPETKDSNEKLLHSNLVMSPDRI